jgi:hypothetical protein
MRIPKDEVIFVPASKAFKRKMLAVVAVLDKTQAEFSRDAISEKIDLLAQQNPKVAEALKDLAA